VEWRSFLNNSPDPQIYDQILVFSNTLHHLIYDINKQHWLDSKNSSIRCSTDSLKVYYVCWKPISFEYPSTNEIVKFYEEYRDNYYLKK